MQVCNVSLRLYELHMIIVMEASSSPTTSTNIYTILTTDVVVEYVKGQGTHSIWKVSLQGCTKSSICGRGRKYTERAARACSY